MITIPPADDANTELVNRVRPPDWLDPQPRPIYDLVVLGGGTAGLVSAIGAAGLGARVALLERHLLGGDCLLTGCVPSKAMIRSARLVGEMKRAASLGVATGAIHVDFSAVMRRMRERRTAIAVHDSAQRVRGAGVDLFFGTGKFVDARSVAIGDHRLRFRCAVIATGSRPAAPPIEGLAGVPFLTNETIFSLTELPRRLLVIGAGPVGCELAQAFARFGSTVSVFDQAPHILPRDDAEASSIVSRALQTDGIRLELGVTLQRVEDAAGQLTLHYSRALQGHVDRRTVTGDAILVATGRAPNIEDLDLHRAGIRATKTGLVVDNRLRTTNARVYASGDVCSEHKFTHAADALSRIVIQNALFYGRRSARTLVIPWVTYTDPEVAHVGVSATDVTRANGRFQTITIQLANVDRAVVDDEVDGFVRVHHENGRIRGCTIVAPHAGELIAQVVYAMTHGGTLRDLSSTIYPYPTQAEALRKAGDVYRRTALTPRVRKWLQRYFWWTRY